MIIYIPVILFSYSLINPSFSAFIYYGTLSFLVLYCIACNSSFYRNNIYAVILVIYLLLLLYKSSDLESVRSAIYPVSWVFISIPLIYAVFKKYDEQRIMHEVGNAAIFILGLFLLNVAVSSIYKYSPNEMYGITSGILYGNLFGANFNILSVALFIAFLRFLDKRRFLYFLILIVSFAVLLLSLRRSVMLVGTVGFVIALLSFLAQKQAKKFVVFSCLLMGFGYFIYTNTSFMDLFKERYEMRNLNDRPLDEEKRFFEYELVYKDMFVYKDYSPWLGYELFKSAGHYGKGVFEERSLHGDLPNMAHSSGLIGVVLYLLTIVTAFLNSYKLARTKLDKLILVFFIVAFTTFTITGRYTESSAMIFMFILLNLPVAGCCPVEVEKLEEAQNLVPIKNLSF